MILAGLADLKDDVNNLAIGAFDLTTIDQDALKSLPPSYQLELFTRMKERKVQVNRDAFQQRQAEPQKFSSFQMEEYLKASDMR